MFRRNIIRLMAMVLMAIATSCVLTSCSDDDHTEKYYKLYNIDSGEDVPVFTSCNNHDRGETQYVPSRTDCTVVSTLKSEDEATTAVIIAGASDTVWVPGKYLFVKEVDGPSKIDNMSGKNIYVDMVLDKVRQLQDSHLHYTSSPLTAKIKFGLLFLLFLVAVIYMVGGFEKAEEESENTPSIFEKGQKWYICLPTVLIGLWMMYYLFIDLIVLGDGYFRAIESGPAFLDFRSLGWFLNLILTLLVGLVYLICAVLFSLVFMFLQLMIVPVIGIGITGVSVNSLIGNTILCFIATIGFALAYLTGSDVILYITLAASVCCVIWLLWEGYSHRQWQSILAVLLPFMYVIIIISVSFLAKFFIATSSVLAVSLLVLGVMTTRSKFQSQGSAEAGSATSDYMCDGQGNRHYVSSRDGDSVYTTDGGRYRRRPDGNYEEY